MQDPPSATPPSDIDDASRRRAAERRAAREAQAAADSRKLGTRIHKLVHNQLFISVASAMAGALAIVIFGNMLGASPGPTGPIIYGEEALEEIVNSVIDRTGGAPPASSEVDPLVAECVQVASRVELPQKGGWTFKLTPPLASELCRHYVQALMDDGQVDASEREAVEREVSVPFCIETLTQAIEQGAVADLGFGEEFTAQTPQRQRAAIQLICASLNAESPTPSIGLVPADLSDG